MGKKRQRRRDRGDWEEVEMEDDSGDVAGSKSSSNRDVVARIGERSDDSDNLQTNEHTSGERSRQNRTSQIRPQLGLGPWTQAVNETVDSMAATRQAIHYLQNQLASHAEDLLLVDELRDKLAEREEECQRKDQELTKLESTISTLEIFDHRAKASIEEKKAKLEAYEKKLEQEKSKMEKRVETATAEEKLKLEKEYKEQTKKLDREYNELRKSLEDEYARVKNEINATANALRIRKEQLEVIVEKQKGTIKTQSEELTDFAEKCDDLKRAKDSVKRDNKALEMELRMIKEEFVLKHMSEDHLKQRFGEVYESIEKISWKYFNDIDGKDSEKVHEQLVAADSHFRSVPIDDTEESHDLRAAHAQRIITEAICEYIWQPLRSEFTLLHPEFDSLLGKISEVLDKSSRDGRAANVWTALTIRALQSLPADAVVPGSPESETQLQANSSARVDKVVSKVLSVLSPLVTLSQRGDLQQELLTLANLAIDVWNNAQTGERRIVIRPLLELAQREEWRSQHFDPADLSVDSDGKDPDAKSRTRPRIFTLFPRVVARGMADPVVPGKIMPGSWESDTRIVETVIHPGRGLPEWSPLVVRGKDVLEERKEFVLKALENARKEFHITRRNQVNGRRESKDSASGPPSPDK